MKKTLILLMITVFSLSLMSGCAYVVKQPVTGFLYSEVKDGMISNEGSAMSKKGTATATSILGWVATGDASITAAMKNGGITKVHHVDNESTGIIGIYATYTTVVYGE